MSILKRERWGIMLNGMIIGETICRRCETDFSVGTFVMGFRDGRFGFHCPLCHEWIGVSLEYRKWVDGTILMVSPISFNLKQEWDGNKGD